MPTPVGFAKIFSAQPTLASAHIITVEADISRGLHAFTTVGLPDKAVEESRDRIAAAIKNSGYTSPKSQNQKIVISLAPADIKKEGPIFDVAIALSYLKAAGEIAFDETGRLFIGELSLDGLVRPVHGALACALEARRRGFHELYVPRENVEEAALVHGIEVFPVRTLGELIEHLASDDESPSVHIPPAPETELPVDNNPVSSLYDEIRGQETAKRGLAIAASGGHNIVLYGPPGTGKTMLARALSELLPPLSFDDVIEVTAIHSSAGAHGSTMVTRAPFRSPHHTASYVSLVGGGAVPKPGEVTLAHRGVLFLDEFPEFDRRVIDALRQPLEEGVVSISRARGSAAFPARFILVAAMNPCPCGNLGSSKPCICMPHALERYRRKISGPIIDRIDMWIEVPHVPHEKLEEKSTDGETKKACERIRAARERQAERFRDTDFALNSEMGVRDLEVYASVERSARNLLASAASRLDLSPRSYHRLIKLARTIADMDASDAVKEAHVLEALQYRPRQAQ